MSSDKLAISTSAAALLATSTMQRKKTGAAGEQIAATKHPAPEQAQPEQKAGSADITAVASRIENYLKSVNRALEFKVDSASGRTIVTVRDAENGELIRQIPNEEVLRFAQLAEEQTVVLLNEKV
jgi:flagellar protein FlaG